MKSEAKVRNGGNGDAELTEVRERAGATLDVTATLETLLEERLRGICMGRSSPSGFSSFW